MYQKQIQDQDHQKTTINEEERKMKEKISPIDISLINCLTQ